MATIKFYTRSTLDKLVPVYIRFTDGRSTNIRIPTPFRIFPKYWSEDKQTLKQRAIYSSSFTELDANKIADKFNQLKNVILLEHYQLGTAPTKEWLKTIVEKFYYKKPTNTETLNQYISRYLEEAKSGKRLSSVNSSKRQFSKETIRGIRDFRNAFNKYQGIYEEPKRKRKDEEEKRPYKPLDFDSITIDTYNDLVQYFYKRGCGPNYTGKIIKNLKTIMHAAREEGLHNNTEVDRRAFKVLKEPAENIYLTQEELNKIEQLDLSNEKHLDIARDVFLVGCYTGQRYSDYSKITADNIKEEDGKKYIVLIQKKTRESCIIPMMPKLEAILSKYNFTLPRTHEQKVNKYIKVVGCKAGVDEDIQFEENKGGLRIKKAIKKYDLIKTHTARRTGITLMYLGGIKVIDIMKISGHRTESEFLKYIRIGKQETAVLLSSHPYFNQGKLSVVN